MKYLSVCSGIEAATVAWHPLGWSAVAFAEIEKFPSAVLAHHYPSVPNLGDMTKFKDWPDADVNVLVGGTPCQSFSIAGLRKGMADPRGNLALTYLAIADRYRPEWIIWENVPGVLSSSEGRDFGAFIAGLAELGYHAAWRVLDAQYIRVDGFARAVPQRRRRVFVVGYFGDWRRAAAVLFERESLLWDSPPRRQTGEGVAPTISARPTGGGGLGTDFDCDGGLVSHALRGEGFDASEDGTGRGTPLVPIAFAQNQREEVRQMDVAGALAAGPGMKQQTYIAFSCKDHGADAGSIAPTLRGMGHDGSHANAGGQLAVAWSIMPQNSGKDYKARQVYAAQPVMAGGPVGGNQGGDYIQHDWAVRRLTPVECCRLQGFPDDYLTSVPYRGAIPPADGPMYKSLGNSMAINPMRWLGHRVAMVSALSSQDRA